MEKFTKLTGVAAPMPIKNVDTDMIIPKQFLKTIQRIVTRARPLGDPRFRHPLRYRAELRRHLLQQLLQERHFADPSAPGRRQQVDG